jgi:3-dehydroquinate synthase
MKIKVQSKFKDYIIHIQNHLLDDLSAFLDLNRRYIIITDDGVPSVYVNKFIHQLNDYELIVFKQGESSKNIDTYQEIINQFLDLSVTKASCVLAIGGGVVGDLSGYIASTYLRGIDYIQIPTTLLSQVDSSVGGKTGINHQQYKNIIGSFYPPIKVLIDPQTLHTLSNRQFNNGIAEVIKYGLLASNELLESLENNTIIKNIDKIIYESLMIKKHYIEIDEFDTFKRYNLNLGHTIGHAYEAYYEFKKYLHGEAVGLGLLKVIKNQSLKNRIIDLLNQYQLPTEDPLDINLLYPFVLKDKKGKFNNINLIIVNDVEKTEIKIIQFDRLIEYLK